jgi:hypothetical protein
MWKSIVQMRSISPRSRISIGFRCGWHTSFNAKPKATASASVDCYTLSADAVAFGLALNGVK